MTTGKVVQLLAVVLVIGSGCIKNEDKPVVCFTIHDHDYGTGPTQKLDFWPGDSTCTSKPLMVMVHGGGWTAGSRSDMEAFRKHCSREGFSVANIDYRLADTLTGITLNHQLADIGQAVDYLSSRGYVQDYSNRKIVLFGYSAGSHLAMMFAYKTDTSRIISAVIALAAPTHLNDSLHQLPWFIMDDVGVVAGRTSHQLGEASPCNYVDDACPTLLIHGSADEIIPCTQSVVLHERLVAARRVSQLIVLEAETHDFNGPLVDSALTTAYKFAIGHSR